MPYKIKLGFGYGSGQCVCRRVAKSGSEHACRAYMTFPVNKLSGSCITLGLL